MHNAAHIFLKRKLFKMYLLQRIGKGYKCPQLTAHKLTSNNSCKNNSLWYDPANSFNNLIHYLKYFSLFFRILINVSNSLYLECWFAGFLDARNYPCVGEWEKNWEEFINMVERIFGGIVRNWD